MRMATPVVSLLTLLMLFGQMDTVPAAEPGRALSAGEEKKAGPAGAAAGTALPAGKIAKNVRCPDNQPWTDENVARSIKVPVARLMALKAARSLTNEQVCTFPEPLLKRAWSKLETGKAGYPDEWAEFRNMQRRSDDGKVKPDGLMKGFEHRKAVLKKIADKKAAKANGGAAPGLQQTVADPAGAGGTTIDIPASGVDTGLAGIAADQWTEVGPNNIGGRIRSILIDPDNTDRIWVGGVAGGIYHSADHGASFSPVNDFMANLAISSMVMDPANHDTMYAGTGEGFFNSDGVRGYGVFKSLDRGATWNFLPATVPSTEINNYAYGWYYVNRLAISSNGSTLLAATRGAYSDFGGSIYRSTDGGASWSQRYTAARVWDLRFDPNDPNKALAATQNYNTVSSKYDNAIIASNNGGLTWSVKMTISSTSRIRIELAYTRADSQIVYASVDQNSGEIWKSTDGGTNWAPTATPQHLGNQGWYDNTIWVDPTDASHLVAGGLDVHRSVSGGATWTKISNWGNNQIDIRYGSGTSHTPHADHHALVADPGYNGTSNRVLYNGNDGGLYRSPDITLAGQTSGWDELNNGIALTQFFSVAGHSAAGTRIIGGTQDNGMLYNAGPGNSWKMFQGGDGGFSAVDAADDNYLYGEYVYLEIGRSTNRGTSYASIDKSGSNQLSDSRSSATANFIAPFILDTNDSNRMLAGGLSLWQNIAVKSGVSWTAIKASMGSKISAIAVGEGDGNIAWVGHNNGAVYRTANSLSASPTWTLVSGALGQARVVNRIVIDRDDPSKVYVSFGGYNNNNLWRTTDNGATWTDLNAPGLVLPAVPIFAFARHPSVATWLYAGTEVGLFTSQDGGVTWSTANDGPANVEISDLAWRDNTTLMAATHGRGIFLATASNQSASTTALTVDTNPSGYGQAVTFTATVTPGSATGTVTFMDGPTTLGSATLAGGSASFTTAGLGVGTHSITALYGSDSNYFGSTSPLLGQSVNPAVLTVTAAAGSKIFGAADPSLTYTASGFVKGDTSAIMSGSLTRVAGEAAGSYAIQQGNLSAGANYTLTFSGANLTIHAAALARMVIAGQPDAQYGSLADAVAAVPVSTATSLRLVGGDIMDGLSFGTDAVLSLSGGYNAALTQKIDGDFTIFHGSLDIVTGTVIVESIVLAP